MYHLICFIFLAEKGSIGHFWLQLIVQMAVVFSHKKEMAPSSSQLL